MNKYKCFLNFSPFILLLKTCCPVSLFSVHICYYWFSKKAQLTISYFFGLEYGFNGFDAVFLQKLTEFLERNIIDYFN